jgi:excisionase family DNA binding protein
LAIAIDATNTKPYNIKKCGITHHKWHQGREFMPKQWLTVEEIAEELGVHPETVRIWIRERELPAVQLRRTYRVKREDYEEFLRRRYTGKQEDKQE